MPMSVSSYYEEEPLPDSLLSTLLSTTPWDQQVQSLEHLTRLALSAPPDPLLRQLRALTPYFCSAIDNQRSTLVKAVCATISTLAQELRAPFVEAVGDALIPNLLYRCSVTKAVIQQSAVDAARSIFEHGAEKVRFATVRTLSDTVADRRAANPRRAAAAEFLGMLLVDNCRDGVQYVLDVIAKALIAGCTDSDERVRALSRENWHRLNLLDPDSARTLLEKLPSNTVQLIQREDPPSPPLERPTPRLYPHRPARVVPSSQRANRVRAFTNPPGFSAAHPLPPRRGRALDETIAPATSRKPHLNHRPPRRSMAAGAFAVFSSTQPNEYVQKQSPPAKLDTLPANRNRQGEAFTADPQSHEQESDKALGRDGIQTDNVAKTSVSMEIPNLEAVEDSHSTVSSLRVAERALKEKTLNQLVNEGEDSLFHSKKKMASSQNSPTSTVSFSSQEKDASQGNDSPDVIVASAETAASSFFSSTSATDSAVVPPTHKVQVGLEEANKSERDKLHDLEKVPLEESGVALASANDDTGRSENSNLTGSPNEESETPIQSAHAVENVATPQGVNKTRLSFILGANQTPAKPITPLPPISSLTAEEDTEEAARAYTPMDVCTPANTSTPFEEGDVVSKDWHGSSSAFPLPNTASYPPVALELAHRLDQPTENVHSEGGAHETDCERVESARNYSSSMERRDLDSDEATKPAEASWHPQVVESILKDINDETLKQAAALMENNGEADSAYEELTEAEDVDVAELVREQVKSWSSNAEQTADIEATTSENDHGEKRDEEATDKFASKPTVQVALNAEGGETTQADSISETAGERVIRANVEATESEEAVATRLPADDEDSDEREDLRDVDIALGAVLCEAPEEAAAAEVVDGVSQTCEIPDVVEGNQSKASAVVDDAEESESGKEEAPLNSAEEEKDEVRTGETIKSNEAQESEPNSSDGQKTPDSLNDEMILGKVASLTCSAEKECSEKVEVKEAVAGGREEWETLVEDLEKTLRMSEQPSESETRVLEDASVQLVEDKEKEEGKRHESPKLVTEKKMERKAVSRTENAKAVTLAETHTVDEDKGKKERQAALARRPPRRSMMPGPMQRRVTDKTLTTKKNEVRGPMTKGRASSSVRCLKPSVGAVTDSQSGVRQKEKGGPRVGLHRKLPAVPKIGASAGTRVKASTKVQRRPPAQAQASRQTVGECSSSVSGASAKGSGSETQTRKPSERQQRVTQAFRACSQAKTGTWMAKEASVTKLTEAIKGLQGDLISPRLCDEICGLLGEYIHESRCKVQLAALDGVFFLLLCTETSAQTGALQRGLDKRGSMLRRILSQSKDGREDIRRACKRVMQSFEVLFGPEVQVGLLVRAVEGAEAQIGDVTCAHMLRGFQRAKLGDGFVWKTGLLETLVALLARLRANRRVEIRTAATRVTAEVRACLPDGAYHMVCRKCGIAP